MRENYKEYEYTVIRFGKHKGKYMKDLPTDYVRWAALNLTDRGMATMFLVEAGRRERALRTKPKK
jgi:uncharacterized protein (DUF3820 family)